MEAMNPVFVRRKTIQCTYAVTVRRPNYQTVTFLKHLFCEVVVCCRLYIFLPRWRLCHYISLRFFHHLRKPKSVPHSSPSPEEWKAESYNYSPHYNGMQPVYRAPGRWLSHRSRTTRSMRDIIMPSVSGVKRFFPPQLCGLNVRRFV